MDSSYGANAKCPSVVGDPQPFSCLRDECCRRYATCNSFTGGVNGNEGSFSDTAYDCAAQNGVIRKYETNTSSGFDGHAKCEGEITCSSIECC